MCRLLNWNDIFVFSSQPSTDIALLYYTEPYITMIWSTSNLKVSIFCSNPVVYFFCYSILFEIFFTWREPPHLNSNLLFLLFNQGHPLGIQINNALWSEEIKGSIDISSPKYITHSPLGDRVVLPTIEPSFAPKRRGYTAVACSFACRLFITQLIVWKLTAESQSWRYKRQFYFGEDKGT